MQGIEIAATSVAGSSGLKPSKILYFSSQSLLLCFEIAHLPLWILAISDFGGSTRSKWFSAQVLSDWQADLNKNVCVFCKIKHE